MFAEVRAWFASDDADGPFTFIAICDSLKFDPTYIRVGLRHWNDHAEATAQPNRRRGSGGVIHHVGLPPLRRLACHEPGLGSAHRAARCGEPGRVRPRADRRSRRLQRLFHRC
jgi:hypothetical protein